MEELLESLIIENKMKVTLFASLFFLISSVALASRPELSDVYLYNGVVEETSSLPHTPFPANRTSVGFAPTLGLPESTSVRSSCGPSGSPNELVCVNLSTKSEIGRFPIPGSLSQAPLFFGDSWLIATNKGFLIRTEGLTSQYNPVLGQASSHFWGAYSRWHMRSLRRTFLKKEGTQKVFDDVFTSSIPNPQGWKWFYAGTSEFVGKPVVLNQKVFALTANQFLHAFDWNTGKLLWAKRIAPDGTLRLGTSVLVTLQNELLLGTDEGRLVSLDPNDGKELWVHRVPTRPEERFRGIVAAPLVHEKSVFVSSAEGTTQKLSLEGHTVEWSYPLGSIATPIIADENVVIGGADGTIAAIEARTGILKWRSSVSSEAPLTYLLTVPERKVLLAFNQLGKAYLLDMKNGKLLWFSSHMGNIVGEPFLMSKASKRDVCVTFASPSLRCFHVNF